MLTDSDTDPDISRPSRKGVVLSWGQVIQLVAWLGALALAIWAGGGQAQAIKLTQEVLIERVSAVEVQQKELLGVTHRLDVAVGKLEEVIRALERQAVKK